MSSWKHSRKSASKRECRWNVAQILHVNKNFNLLTKGDECHTSWHCYLCSVEFSCHYLRASSKSETSSPETKVRVTVSTSVLLVHRNGDWNLNCGDCIRRKKLCIRSTQQEVFAHPRLEEIETEKESDETPMFLKTYVSVVVVPGWAVHPKELIGLKCSSKTQHLLCSWFL